VKHWAEGFGDYYSAGDRAPMTDAKRELIYESRSIADKEIMRIAEYIADLEEPAAVTLRGVKAFIQSQVQKQIFVDNREIVKACKEGGLIAYDQRLKHNGFVEKTVYNRALHERLRDCKDDSEFRDGLRRYIKSVDRLINAEM
jgi:hypothetical protein